MCVCFTGTTALVTYITVCLNLPIYVCLPVCLGYKSYCLILWQCDYLPYSSIFFRRITMIALVPVKYAWKVFGGCSMLKRVLIRFWSCNVSILVRDVFCLMLALALLPHYIYKISALCLHTTPARTPLNYTHSLQCLTMLFISCLVVCFIVLLLTISPLLTRF